MPNVMSFVICFGVSRGVQMVFRYPPEGVGLDLYGREIPTNSDLATTLGVRTDHLSFLLCPQQIREIPEHDVISVEAFSFFVRYFHVPVGPIKHLAIVVAVECSDGKDIHDSQHRFSSFLNAYTTAIIREQNRCAYLQVTAGQLTVKRDQCEDKGTWRTLFNAVSDLSLVHELVTITTTLRTGGSLRLHVNNWLYLEGEITVEDGLSSSLDIHNHPRDEDRFIYLMIHSDLPLPLEKELIEKAAEIVKEVSLPELLTLVAVPTSVQDFRKRIERKLAKNARQTHQSSDPMFGKEKEELLNYTTFSKLLQFLVSNGITRILRTYFVFQPLLFATASQQAISRRNQKVPKQQLEQHDLQSYENDFLEQELELELELEQDEGSYSQQPQQQQQPKHQRSQQQPKQQNIEPIGNSSVRFLSGARDDRKRVVTTNRLNVEKHITFLEMITRHSKLCPGVTSVDVIGNLRSTIDFFDGKTPKEEILARIPSLTSSALDEVVTVFNEFIATIIA
eukprot:TRINITY_DN12081_c0_g1_i1.p1 TRINITY_DN12081_c0_g1~~TRINITY_DN12081_c0_g1_i1.p1  ORF type:complete len:507 (+),score=103.89 TRINITY_DN12081_c0_g1_i1:57-1577(+)